MSLSPTLFNAHGLANEDRHLCRIQVIPDKAPVARVIVRSPSDGTSVANVPLLIDTGAAVSLLPAASVSSLIELSNKDAQYEGPVDLIVA